MVRAAYHRNRYISHEHGSFKPLGAVQQLQGVPQALRSPVGDKYQYILPVILFYGVGVALDRGLRLGVGGGVYYNCNRRLATSLKRNGGKQYGENYQ